MSELLTTLKDMLGGGKVRWPSQRRGTGGVAPAMGESSSGEQRPHTLSSGHRPKRPAPTKPPVGRSQSRDQKDRHSLVITNRAAAQSQEEEEVETERESVNKATSLSQDTGTSRALSENAKREEKTSISHKPVLHGDTNSSQEPLLLKESKSLSAEEKDLSEVIPVVQPVPAAPSVPGQEEVDSGPAAAGGTEQKKKRHRKSGEIKYDGEVKHRSKSKHKKKSEHKRSSVKEIVREEDEESKLINQAMFKMSEPLNEGGVGELPLPQEIAEAAADEALMTGSTKGDEDFILEPPSKFSQSSVDYLDDFGDIDDSGALSFDFAPPTAPSDEELEDEPHPPPPPITHGNGKITPVRHPPPPPPGRTAHASRSADGKKKKSLTSKQGKTTAITSKKKKGEGQRDSRPMDEQWKGLDYPVRHSPWTRSSQEEVDQASRLTFPPDNRENQFAGRGRDAMEEESDEDERGVVLNEDVAALLW